MLGITGEGWRDSNRMALSPRSWQQASWHMTESVGPHVLDSRSLLLHDLQRHCWNRIHALGPCLLPSGAPGNGREWGIVPLQPMLWREFLGSKLLTGWKEAARPGVWREPWPQGKGAAALEASGRVSKPDLPASAISPRARPAALVYTWLCEWGLQPISRVFMILGKILISHIQMTRLCLIPLFVSSQSEQTHPFSQRVHIQMQTRFYT